MKELSVIIVFLKSSLDNHMQSVREGTKPIKCNICDYKTALKGDLKKHIEPAHEGMKPFLCNICGYKTADKGSL